MNIYEKLNCIVVELKAPKSQFNDFANFKFRSIEDIYIYLKPLLFKYKLALIPTDTIEEINGVNYVKTRLTLLDAEKPNDIINVTALAREPAEKPKMDVSQTTLSAATFARKSALCNLFLIDDSIQSTAEALHFPPVITIPPPVCTVCGEEIPNVGEATAIQIAKASKQKYGVVMCKACCDTKRRMQEAETAPAEKPEPKAEQAPATTPKPKGRPPKAK